MRRRLLLAALLLLLSACTSREKYEAMLETWLGASESQLLGSWGPPDSVYEHRGVRYLTWAEEYEYHTTGTPSRTETTVVGKQVVTTVIPGTPGRPYTTHCETTFLLRDDRIIDWQARGAACQM